ncbi:invasin domain 3-containing protein (plasmid) [Enterobacter hormaechei]|uniref:phage tail tube protein n=1 Tax=Enterobacter hormaechei TaxID=158836 RepID=UPI002B4BB34A|nr:invasin domain 3-containing protein [Enterobacter hormaechei]WRM07087.1 invasin domain 3-containing protein [Enterobacter hormaechei]
MATCVNEKNNLVLGRGRLFFDRQDSKGNPTGERYLGNTPELNATQDVTTLDHFASDYGVKEMDDQMTLQNTRSGSFITDNISIENVAAFFGGFNQTIVSTQQTDVKEGLNGSKPITRGYFYQLGQSVDEPQGLGNIDPANFELYYAAGNASIVIGSGDLSTVVGLTLLPAGNYELEADTGRVYIEPDAPDLVAPAQIYAQYNRKAGSTDMFITSDDTVRGALRFISDNPKGLQMNYYWPLVNLTPNGDYALKGDDWQQLSFNFGVLKKDCNTPSQITYRPTPDAGNAGSGATVSTMTLNPTSIAGDNTATSTVTVTVLDANGQPANNQQVTLARGALPSGVTDVTLAQTTLTTNASGVATTTVKATATGAGTVQITATVVSSGATKTSTLSVTAP